jgi:hypothetical protein
MRSGAARWRASHPARPWTRGAITGLPADATAAPLPAIADEWARRPGPEGLDDGTVADSRIGGVSPPLARARAGDARTGRRFPRRYLARPPGDRHPPPREYPGRGSWGSGCWATPSPPRAWGSWPDSPSRSGPEPGRWHRRPLPRRGRGRGPQPDSPQHRPLGAWGRVSAPRTRFSSASAPRPTPHAPPRGRSGIPALLRQLFRLGCEYSGQVLSYQKMLGQLQDAGTTTTLAHYLRLLGSAGMLTGLQKFTGARRRHGGSIPKLLVLNTALMTAPSGLRWEEAREDREFWGRLVETAVGAHLVNTSLGTGATVSYWRERNQEVDFVLADPRRTLGIAVKSGSRRTARPGLEAFGREYPGSRKLLVGADGLSVADARHRPADTLLGRG